MKKLAASVGLVALGASAVQLASAQSWLAPDSGKPWTVSATVRGFYDDNFATVPNDFDLGGADRESFGYEISPSVAAGWNLENTVMSLAYTYSYKYFENVAFNRTDHDDQTHTINAMLNHAFTERHRLALRDSFVVGQEPDILRAGNTFTTFQRVSGDNFRNYGSVTFDMDLTPKFGIQLGYDNAWFDYEDEGDGSLSAMLDRFDHYAHIDGKYKLTPQTDAILGYQFGLTDYTSDNAILEGSAFTGEVRNSRSHYVYVGADHTFSPELSAALRLGARIIDFYNDPSNESTVSPYVRLSGRYLYAEESFIEGGVSYDRASTDLVGNEGDFTMDADTALVFASINHRITPKLYGSAMGQIQSSMYNNGTFDGDSEQFYLVGLNLEYRFNRHFAAHAGYNYDLLESDSSIDRGFDRNRVYIGLTATY